MEKSLVKNQPRDAVHGTSDRDESTRFGATLKRVLLVQLVTLALLWLLQATFHT